MRHSEAGSRQQAAGRRRASIELNFNFCLSIYPADLFLILDTGGSHAFSIIGLNKQMLYDYEGNVLVGAKPQDESHPSPPTSGWIVRGKLTLQRQSELVLAAAVSSLVPGINRKHIRNVLADLQRPGR